MASGGRVDLDGGAVAPLTICMIGAGGFIGSHLCEKLMAETPHTVLAVDVYCDKIRHLVDPPPPHLAGRISFHRLNIKNDSRLEGLIKMADLVRAPPPSTPPLPSPARSRPLMADWSAKNGTSPPISLGFSFLILLPIARSSFEKYSRHLKFWKAADDFVFCIGGWLVGSAPRRR